VRHYEQVLAGEDPAPLGLRIHLDGTAGVGKSRCIEAISRTLGRMAGEHDRPYPVLRIAPSGIAAFNILGLTIHTGLDISNENLKQASYTSHEGKRLDQLQQRLAGRHYIIIDEKSMVGLKMLGWIDLRLQDATPERLGEHFGGRSVLLCGDFGQLPPIGDMALFKAFEIGLGKLSGPAEQGRLAYRSFGESIEFTENMRQLGPEEQRFRDVLLRLRAGEIEAPDHEFLLERVLSNLPADIQNGFRDVTRLMPTRAEVAEHNAAMLRAARRPVLRVPAKHNCDRAKRMSEDDAKGLSPLLYLQRGATVMLTRNVWTPQGLTNGAVGTLGACKLEPHTTSRAETNEQNKSCSRRARTR
jgi:ATP-dependent DNA helicase PIF1